LETIISKKMRPLFISINRLKEFSVVNSNVDEKLISPTIIMVQDLFLQEILGTDLYDEICSQIDAGSVSANNTTLLNDYIEPYLMNMTIAEGLQNFHIKISNTDVINQNTENAQGASSGGIANFKNLYRNTAENYAMTLYKYLCANASTYPLYRNGNTESWKTKPKRFEYSTGIFTGNRRLDPRNRFKNGRFYDEN